MTVLKERALFSTALLAVDMATSTEMVYSVPGWSVIGADDANKGEAWT